MKQQVVDGDGTVTAYWSHPSAGLNWPQAFDSNNTIAGCGLPIGGQIGSQSTRSINAEYLDQNDVNDNGNSTEIIRGYTIHEFMWMPPNPDDYQSCFNTIEHRHFCVLAIIDDGTSLSLNGIISDELNNNNDMALHNITVLGSDDNDHADFAKCEAITWGSGGTPNPGTGSTPNSGCVLFGNYTAKRLKNVNVAIEFPSKEDEFLFKNFDINIYPQEDILKKWLNGEVKTEGLQYDRTTHSIKVLKPGSNFTLPTINERAVYSVCMRVSPKSNVILQRHILKDKKSFDFDLVQRNNGKLQSGERYTFDLKNFQSANDEVIGTRSPEQNDQLIESVEVYPNPTKDFLFINKKDQNTYQVSIIDMLGKEVFKREGARGEIKIDIHNLNPDFYLIKVLDATTGIESITKILIL